MPADVGDVKANYLGTSGQMQYAHKQALREWHRPVSTCVERLFTSSVLAGIDGMIDVCRGCEGAASCIGV
jgi:hypothetical protein